MRFDELPDGAIFYRPDVVHPGTLYAKKDDRTYHEWPAGWSYGRDRDEPPITCRVERVEVEGWANGYGIWLARVKGPDTDIFRGLVGHVAALDKIRWELAQREGPDFAPASVGVKREATDLLPHGRVALTYKEVPA